MAVLKYKIIELPEMEYLGYRVEVPLNDVSSVDFQSLWRKVMSEYIIQDDEYYIGFEDYSSFNGKSYYYYALAPLRDYCSTDGREVIRIPNGRYYRYENILNSHGPHFFEQVYGNLKRKGVIHDSTFDLEMIPNTFSYDNPESAIYVAVKEKE